MTTYNLYGFTNEKSIDVSNCIMFLEDTKNAKPLISYSELYYLHGFYKYEFPLKPNDFKYILQVTVKLDNVFIVKSADDYIPNMFSSDGSVNLDIIKQKTNKNIQGYILYDINELHKSQYIPIVHLPKICIAKASLIYKQAPLQRSWISVEECENYNYIQCINSQSCILKTSRKANRDQKTIKQNCKKFEKYQELKLQDLKHIMIPFKYYSFTEYQTSFNDTDFQFSHGFKPRGFWFSQGDEWLQHMKKTNFRLNTYNYLYELEINLDEFILINNLKDLYEFTQKFCKKALSNQKTDNQICWHINWDNVVKKTKKSGILISPNLKKIILKYKNGGIENFKSMEWYITWDIASGAIWNSKGVKKIQLIYKKEDGTFIEYKKR